MRKMPKLLSDNFLKF